MRIPFKASITRTEDMKALVFALGQIKCMEKGVDCQEKRRGGVVIVALVEETAGFSKG